MPTLAGKTLLVTGASRGIGRALALRAASDGANVVIAAKTSRPHEKLPGTIHDTARDVEKAGGKALALEVDVRDADRIARMVEEAVAAFGGLDILVNNAGAISLLTAGELPPKRFDLMMAINLRAPFLCAQAALPHLKKAANPHILNLSPPMDLDARWFEHHAAYTTSKYGMSLLTIGLAAEFREFGIAVNSLWPRTTIATAATQMLGGEEFQRTCRTPEIVSDAAHAILTSPSREVTGRFFLDEDLLRSRGITDFRPYAVDPSSDLTPDLYVS